MRILVTGANGFIGSALCRELAARGHSVRAVVRNASSYHPFQHPVELTMVDNIFCPAEWEALLAGIDTVIHLAARTHIINETSADPLSAYRKINVEGTRSLAEAAPRAGVQRIVFLSSIKVNGEATTEDPFTENDLPSPQDAYATSKLEAELVIRDLSGIHGTEFVILRPPLIYGPGVKGNLLRLMRYINKGFPLPFGNIDNKRSLISLGNLVDILILASLSVKCSGQILLVSDGKDVSTSDIVCMIAEAMGQKRKLMDFPHNLAAIMVKLMPSILPAINRLTGSLVIDSSFASKILDWSPPQVVKTGFESMVAHFMKEMRYDR
jgi:nucleoside-diphosphate-sugar epimerase